MNGSKKILITGASGYIGSRLCYFFAKQGHQIIALFSSTIPQKTGWTDLIDQTIVGDIREIKTIKKISEVKADVIIHLISLDHHDSEKSPDFVSKVNIQSTWNLLNECTLSNGVSKFIYFSTIHVYGKNQKGLVQEDQKGTPSNIYGMTHLLSEEICNYYNRTTDTDCINVRLSNSYGEPIFPDAKCWTLIVNNLARSAYRDNKIILNSDGRAVRDFIHFSDICNGLNQLIDGPSVGDKNTLHFSSSTSISMLEVALKVKEVYHKKYGVKIPIYINKDQLFTDNYNNLNNSNSIISNSLATSQSIEFRKKLSEGIDDLFKYFENETAQ